MRNDGIQRIAASLLLVVAVTTRKESLSFALVPAAVGRWSSRPTRISQATIDGDTSVLDAPASPAEQEDKESKTDRGVFEKVAIRRNNETEEEWLDDGISIFDIVAGRAAACLVESDLRRDAKAGYGNVVSSSATNWINDATAFALQKAFDRVKLKVRQKRNGPEIHLRLVLDV